MLTPTIPEKPEPPLDEDPARYLAAVEAIEARLAGRNLTGTVLLTGSSIMEFWQTSESDLLPLKTVNIGIGGTKVFDHISYFERLVLPYAPRAVLIYAGSNDINGVPGSSKSGARTAELVIEYLERIRAHFLAMPIFYISIIEAPSKAGVIADIRKANRLIAAHMQGRESLHFIDCTTAMQNERGEADPSLYLEDQLHLRPAGYARWRNIIRPRLLNVLG